jgi:hypothetical protein
VGEIFICDQQTRVVGIADYGKNRRATFSVFEHFQKTNHFRYEKSTRLIEKQTDGLVLNRFIEIVESTPSNRTIFTTAHWATSTKTKPSPDFDENNFELFQEYQLLSIFTYTFF